MAFLGQCARFAVSSRLQRAQSVVRKFPSGSGHRSLSASTITFPQVQQGFLLTVNGKELSLLCRVINGTTLSTTVLSSQQLQVTISTALSLAWDRERDRQHAEWQLGLCGCSSGGTVAC